MMDPNRENAPWGAVAGGKCLVRVRGQRSEWVDWTQTGDNSNSKLLTTKAYQP